MTAFLNDRPTGFRLKTSFQKILSWNFDFRPFCETARNRDFCALCILSVSVLERGTREADVWALLRYPNEPSALEKGESW